jgi:23S rRNA (uridine2552-2'-O)-methyltransferase
MAKGSSSKRWLQRQDKDPYVKRAQADGWRSRAVFKLIEIQKRDRLIRHGGVIVDLGAAPGSWSQYAASVAGDEATIIAVDILPMDPVSGVTGIQGDFRDEQVIVAIRDRLAGVRVDLVMSDMAPNISGNVSVDQPRAMYLAELALDLAGEVLGPGGHLVVKLFHGEGFDRFVRDIRPRFETVKVRKPEASRPSSRETYLVARNYRV